MRQRYDIAIAGCGPAGLATALLLERAGHNVTLVERFSTPQPLGSGLILQPTGLAVLHELQLAQPLIALGSRIDRLFGLAHPSGSVVLDVRYEALKTSTFGVGIHRAALFNTLFDAVQQRNLPIERNFEITGIDRAPDSRPIILAEDGRRLGPFELVVDALGARSPLLGHAKRPAVERALDYGAIWANVPMRADLFDPHALEQRYWRASVMTGVLPIGRQEPEAESLASFFWSIKPVDYQAWKTRGLAAWKADVQRYWPETSALLDAIHSAEQPILASYRHQTLPTPFGDRIVFVGDSAHATSPQLGQGANMALLDAYALAKAIDEAPSLHAALAAYARTRRWHVRLYQAASRMFTPFYQSDSVILPLIRDRAVAPVARLPGVDRFLATLVAGFVGNPLGKLGLSNTAFGTLANGRDPVSSQMVERS